MAWSMGLLGATYKNPPAFELLSTVLLSNDLAGSITFSNLNTYTDYKHLQIRLTARSSGTGYTGFMQMRFNGDSGSNYTGHSLRGNGTNVTSSGGTDNRIFLGQLPNASDTANVFFAAVVDILDFSNANKNTTTRHLDGLDEDVSNVARIFFRSGLWNNTAAITSINISMDNAFTAGSRFSLYGVK